jgi:hypothetical protein
MPDQPPRFSELEWKPGFPGSCEWAEVCFPNGWRASFLRGSGRNASIHMDPDGRHFVGPYEILPWAAEGPVVDGPEGNWPKHGDADTMQRLMDVLATQEPLVQDERSDGNPHDAADRLSSPREVSEFLTKAVEHGDAGHTHWASGVALRALARLATAPQSSPPAPRKD